MMKQYIKIVTILVFGIGAFSGSIPGYLTVCHRDMSNLSKCLLKAAQAAKPYVGNGIKSLGLPPFAPFELAQVSFEQGTSGVSYKTNLTKIKIYGLNNYTFRNLSFDPKDLSLRGTVFFEKTDVTANYDVKGKILVAEIKGAGMVSVNTGPTTATFDLAGELSRDGKHIVPKKVMVDIGVSTGKAHFKGSINDNEELSRATNEILNENAEALLKDAVPALEKIAGEVLVNIWGNINRIISYDQLLPLSPKT